MRATRMRATRMRAINSNLPLKCHKSVLNRLKNACLIADISYYDCYQTQEQLKEFPENSKIDQIGDFSFVHPGNQILVADFFLPNTQVKVDRFCLLGNSAKKLIKNLLLGDNYSKNCEKLAKLKSGQSAEFILAADPSCTRPKLKSHLPQFFKNYEQTRASSIEMQDSQPEKTLKIYIKAVEHRQGRYQKYELLIPQIANNLENYANPTHKIWLNLVYNGGFPIAEENLKFLQHENLFARHFPDDFLENGPMQCIRS